MSLYRLPFIERLAHRHQGHLAFRLIAHGQDLESLLAHETDIGNHSAQLLQVVHGATSQKKPGWGEPGKCRVGVNRLWQSGAAY